MNCIPDKAEILLINPPSGIFYGLGPNFAPIGLFSLAAFLKRHGFTVSVLNANFNPDYLASSRRRPGDYYYAEDRDNPIWEQVLAFIEALEPKLVGFSCHDLAVGGIKYLAQTIKKRSPGRLVAVGGPTPSGAADVFDACPDVDYILAGEGEATLLELARSLKGNGWNPLPSGPAVEAIAGLYHRSGNSFTYNGPRPRLSDLDQLPDADRAYYWLDYERRLIVRDAQLNGVSTSRGCLKACHFCGARAIWPGPVTYRSIDRVIGEVADLRRQYGYDFQHFSIFDDDFLARPERVFDFCRQLSELGDDYKFRCYGRVNNLQDEEMIEALIRSGCQEIWVGVESGSQKVLKALGKGITVPQIKRLDRLFKNYDFPWLAFIILGTPSETEADIEQTLNLLKEGHFPSIQPFTFQPYTGTELFRQLRASGLLTYKDIICSHQNLPQCFSQQVEPKRFWELLEQLNRLAEERRRGWIKELQLEPEQIKAAELWEAEAADFLATSDDRFLVLGPERQLRWLAALNHYRGLGADLMLVDAQAKESNLTRFGAILSRAEADAHNRDKVLIVAPEDQARRWLELAASFYPGIPAVVLGDNENKRPANCPSRPTLSDYIQSGGQGRPQSRRLWRPVAEICRSYKTAEGLRQAL